MTPVISPHYALVNVGIEDPSRMNPNYETIGEKYDYISVEAPVTNDYENIKGCGCEPKEGTSALLFSKRNFTVSILFILMWIIAG